MLLDIGITSVFKQHYSAENKSVSSSNGACHFPSLITTTKMKVLYVEKQLSYKGIS